MRTLVTNCFTVASVFFVPFASVMGSPISSSDNCGYSLVESGYSDPYGIGPRKLYITHVGKVHPLATLTTKEALFKLGGHSVSNGWWNKLSKRIGLTTVFTASIDEKGRAYIDFDFEGVISMVGENVKPSSVSSVILTFDRLTAINAVDVFGLYSPLNYKIQHAITFSSQVAESNRGPVVYSVSFNGVDGSFSKRYVRIYISGESSAYVGIRFAYSSTNRDSRLDELERQPGAIVSYVHYTKEYSKMSTVPLRPLYDHRLEIYNYSEVDRCLLEDSEARSSLQAK